MPLPPSIIPESEDPGPNLLSEASSGYISTSLSTATLSDVYTLSWDLPSLAAGVDDVDGLTDKGDCTGEDLQSVHRGKAEFQDSLLVPKEVASWKVDEPTHLEMGDTAPDSGLNHQDANMHLAVKVKEQAFALDIPCQQELKEHSLVQHPGSEQINNSKTLDDSLLESLPKNEQSDVLQKEPADSENSRKEGQVGEITVDVEGDHSGGNVTMATVHEVDSEITESEMQVSANDNPAFVKAQSLNTQGQDLPEVLEPAVDSTGGLDLKVQGTSGSSNPNGTNTPPLSSSTDEAKVETPTNVSAKAEADPSQSKVSTSKPNTLAVNPFKIQKVKSSDLHSFQSIIEKGEGESEQLDPDGSPGAGNKLAVPIENLEIISDPEEGDAAGTVLPDWLKEGEFVTVGTNKCGTVRFVGPTDFAEGIWVGVELEAPAGRQTSCQHILLMNLSSIAVKLQSSKRFILQAKMMVQLAASTTSTVTQDTAYW